MAEKQAKSTIAQREEEVLAFWRERDIFKKSLEKGATKGEYVFYDGPPFATGLPHYGHIVASVIKDVIPRYKTMRGYHVPRVWGWDCHGLPIENIVEKELGFKHKKDIKEYGIAKFNERCRERVLTYAGEWEKIIPRIGRWADMEHAYRTMDKPFMESVWWVFKQLWDKGLVYEDYRSMHICPRCETTLSQTEISEGYKDVKDIAVTVKFKVKDPEKHGLPESTYFLAWTTTPWTLPGNVALAVGEKIKYALARKGEEYFILGRDKVSDEFTLEREVSGAALVGIEYEPPFDYYINDKTLKNSGNGWKVYAADFVTTDVGTGIAHEAPAFGADDWELLRKVNVPFVQHVNMDGTFKPEVKDFAGIEVKPQSEDERVRLGADIAILKYLQDHGTFFSKENIVHPYPHCWRCDTPLLNYATSSWFVNVTKMKADLLKNAESISWSPAHIKKGRFGDWLEGARDWSISRQRFWASVIPVWRCEKCKKEKVFGSAAELEEASGKKVDDLHKHIVDEITVPCECGGTKRRISDVLDTWFDSGSMPYGERHYPFAFSTDPKGETFRDSKVSPWSKIFPAQFIAEGLDQTRAWFYYLHVLGGALFQKSAFQNVIVNGIVLAEDGKKMSKKLQNYPDPIEIVEKYGADALRLYLLSSPVMQAENLNFMEKGVDEMVKKSINRLNNVLAFYELYKDDTERDHKSANILDQWILARLAALIGETTEGYEKYRLDEAVRPLALFIDDLSVWYLRRSRDRFKKDGDDPSNSLRTGKKEALATMRYVLHTLARVMAPSTPFFAEYLFQAVREEEDEESVHLTMWPEIPEFNFDPVDVLASMFATRFIVSQALEARDTAKIKVRQPLAKLTIPAEPHLSQEYMSLIQDEVNVKEIIIGTVLEFDTNITQELREEGLVRDTIREIQAFRKDQNLKPGEFATYRITVSVSDRRIIEKHVAHIKKVTHTNIEFAEEV